MVLAFEWMLESVPEYGFEETRTPLACGDEPAIGLVFPARDPEYPGRIRIAEQDAAHVGRHLILVCAA